MFNTTLKPAILFLFVSLSLSSVAQPLWRVSTRVKESAATLQGNVTYAMKDSVLYAYDAIAGRGSDYLNTKIDFDSTSTYWQDSSGLDLWGNSYATYNSANQVLTRYNVYRRGFTDTLTADTFTYSNGLLASHTAAGTYTKAGVKYWVVKKITKYFYNSLQQLIFVDSFDFQNNVGMPIRNVARRYYRYDADGRVICDSMQVPKNGSWEDFEYIYYYFNSAGINYLTRRFYGTNCGDQDFNYHIYESDRKITDSVIYLANLGQPNNYAAITRYTYHANGLLKTKDYYNSSTGNIGFGYSYTYTSFDYLSSVTMYKMSANNVLETTERIRYKYEHYWPADVSNVSGKDNALALYPVPTYDRLHINWQAGNTSSIRARVTDLLGREVVAWTDNVSGEYKKDVEVGHLPAGQYFLQITAANNSVSEGFVIVK